MNDFVEEFESRIGRSLKHRERGVLGELADKYRLYKQTHPIKQVQKIKPESGDIVIVVVSDELKNNIPDCQRSDHLKATAKIIDTAVPKDVQVIAMYDTTCVRILDDDLLASMGLKKI